MSETRYSDGWPVGQELCELTILTCEGKHVATKTFTPAGAVAFNAGWRYFYRGRAALGLCGLYRLLDKLSGHAPSFVISGVPREGLELDRAQRRRYRAEDCGDELPEVMPADQRWVCIDVDALEVEGADQMTPRERAFELLCALPRCFISAGCVVQWSSSAGVGGWSKLKAHLWFILDRPAYCKSWKEWLALEVAAGRSCAVDGALYNPVQPHYTAAPIFRGVADPLAGERLLLVPGPAVRVPAAVLDLAGWQQLEIQREQDRIAVARAEQARLALVPIWGRARAEERYAQGALKRACEGIAGEAEGGRHARLRDEAWALFRFVESGDLTEREWRDALHSAGVAAVGAAREAEVVSILNGCVARRGAA
jgi:hypothetical protein